MSAKTRLSKTGMADFFSRKVVLALLLSLSTVLSAQTVPKMVDLTVGRRAGTLEEVRDAARFTTVSVSEGEQERLPIAVTMEFLGPVSLSSGTARVDISLRNIGSIPVSVPVSREMRLLHDKGNQDRRSLTCNLRLTSDKSPATGLAMGLLTFSSSTDGESTAKLRPGESLMLRFDARFSHLWELGSSNWKDDLAGGVFEVRTECSEQVLSLGVNASPEQRKYFSHSSEVVTSLNAIRASAQP